MTAGYVPQLGDLAVIDDWKEPRSPVRIVAVVHPPEGRTWTSQAIGLEEESGHYYAWPLDRWERYVEPVAYPELWFALSSDGHPTVYRCAPSEKLAYDERGNEEPPIGILHLHPDGTTTMEQP